MATITATEARRRLYQLLDEVAASHEPVQITGRRGNAVLVSEDDWRAVQETLYLLSVPGMRESIREGMATPIDDLEDEARLVTWRLRFTKQAQKDAAKLTAAGLRPKTEALLDLLREDPFRRPPPFEKPVGDLRGAYSRRINLQHRLVYEVVADERVVKVLRMWTHYEVGDAVTDDPVLARILDVARADPRVRAVVLSGSRADPEAPDDRWRDHDVVFVVRDVAPYRADPAWVDAFGERTILQRPDAMLGAPGRDDGGEAWLMLFEDGSRIDLTLLPVAAMASFEHDGPARVLVDLDGVVPPPPPPDAPHFVPDPPTAAAFADVCNEFWWVAPYVAKGLARGEATYAHHHLDVVLRGQLLTMLGWEVAAASGFRRGPGKHGRSLRRELVPVTWMRLEATYSAADPEATWAALEAMCGLFRHVARRVAARYGFAYPQRDDERVSAHLWRVREAVTDERQADSTTGGD